MIETPAKVYAALLLDGVGRSRKRVPCVMSTTIEKNTLKVHLDRHLEFDVWRNAKTVEVGFFTDRRGGTLLFTIGTPAYGQEGNTVSVAP